MEFFGRSFGVEDLHVPEYDSDSDSDDGGFGGDKQHDSEDDESVDWSGVYEEMAVSPKSSQLPLRKLSLSKQHGGGNGGGDEDPLTLSAITGGVLSTTPKGAQLRRSRSHRAIVNRSAATAVLRRNRRARKGKARIGTVTVDKLKRELALVQGTNGKSTPGVERLRRLSLPTLGTAVTALQREYESEKKRAAKRAAASQHASRKDPGRSQAIAQALHGAAQRNAASGGRTHKPLPAAVAARVHGNRVIQHLAEQKRSLSKDVELLKVQAKYRRLERNQRQQLEHTNPVSATVQGANADTAMDALDSRERSLGRRKARGSRKLRTPSSRRGTRSSRNNSRSSSGNLWGSSTTPHALHSSTSLRSTIPSSRAAQLLQPGFADTTVLPPHERRFVLAQKAVTPSTTPSTRVQPSACFGEAAKRRQGPRRRGSRHKRVNQPHVVKVLQEVAATRPHAPAPEVRWDTVPDGVIPPDNGAASKRLNTATKRQGRDTIAYVDCAARFCKAQVVLTLADKPKKNTGRWLLLLTVRPMSHASSRQRCLLSIACLHVSVPSPSSSSSPACGALAAHLGTTNSHPRSQCAQWQALRR